MHNYIDLENGILRKGSVSAKAGELLLIPMNMRDGTLVCRGRGNPDWNFSAPHGAGRIMSRSKAKERLAVEDMARDMEGVWSTSVGEATLDEAPAAYKPMEDILRHIGPTAEVVDIMRPKYNFKAGETIRHRARHEASSSPRP